VTLEGHVPDECGNASTDWGNLTLGNDARILSVQHKAAGRLMPLGIICTSIILDTSCARDATSASPACLSPPTDRRTGMRLKTIQAFQLWRTAFHAWRAEPTDVSAVATSRCKANKVNTGTISARRRCSCPSSLLGAFTVQYLRSPMEHWPFFEQFLCELLVWLAQLYLSRSTEVMGRTATPLLNQPSPPQAFNWPVMLGTGPWLLLQMAHFLPKCPESGSVIPSTIRPIPWLTSGCWRGLGQWRGANVVWQRRGALSLGWPQPAFELFRLVARPLVAKHLWN
jgi:hypothetical protein